MEKIKNTSQYYSGGLAEIEPTPSELTFSYFKEWFTGKNSVGKAMKLLKLPYLTLSQPLVELQDNELVVNLKTEEATLYRNTIFHYKPQKATETTPLLEIQLWKLLSPSCWLNTLRTIAAQARWIAQQQQTITFARNLVNSIPDANPERSSEEISTMMGDKVWPVVIAVGFLSEFYFQLAQKEAGKKQHIVTSFISSQVAKSDWFFRSYADQIKVKEGEMTLAKYLELYGIRGDQDYELTSPRWQEIPTEIKVRIKEAKGQKHKQIKLAVPAKVLPYAETAIAFQLLRSETKQKALESFNHLRQALIREKKIINKEESLRKKVIKRTSSNVRNGRGVGVAQGKISGTALVITSTSQKISPGTIGIFPNASPHFALQFPKCDGLIFLKGGQTSHGAIVAREFGIPAIIAPDASAIPNNAKVQLDGKEGTWRIV